jgi:hypothetical protein
MLRFAPPPITICGFIYFQNLRTQHVAMTTCTLTVSLNQRVVGSDPSATCVRLVVAAFQQQLLSTDKSGQRASWFIDRFICSLLTTNTNKDDGSGIRLPLPLHLVIGSPSIYLTSVSQNVRRHAQLARQNTAVSLILNIELHNCKQ